MRSQINASINKKEFIKRSRFEIDYYLTKLLILLPRYFVVQRRPEILYYIQLTLVYK